MENLHIKFKKENIDLFPIDEIDDKYIDLKTNCNENIVLMNKSNLNEIKESDSKKLTIEDFCLFNHLGNGSFSKVVLGKNINSNKLYAIKITDKYDVIFFSLILIIDRLILKFMLILKKLFYLI